MSIYDISAEDQVKNLPSAISSVKSSDRIKKLNVKHKTKHETVLSHYVGDIKLININVMEKLKVLCSAAEEQIASSYFTIDRHFETLRIQDSLSSVEEFNTIWSSIETEVDRILKIISEMESSIIKSCSHPRVECIKEAMTHYFDMIKSAGVWDSRKLVNFFDDDLLSINLDLLNNYRKYVIIVSNMKATTRMKVIGYRRNWEKHLLGWRDFLVHKNLSIVQDMLLSDEFSKSKELEIWHTEAFNLLKQNDDLIIQSYKEILSSLPYIHKSLTSFSLKIRRILEDKEQIARNYLDKATIHYRTLIQKFEWKLTDIKGFLFREASCNEEQFQKSFSRFIHDGDQSYEKIAHHALNDYESEVTENLEIMNEVHTVMIQFLSSISEAWGENADKIKDHRKDLLNDLKKCRDHHDGSSKILEKDIDKILSKISEVSSTVKLEKLLEKVRQKLNELKKKLKELFSRMESLILAYPQRCSHQSRVYESSMLGLIGLKKATQIIESASMMSHQKNDMNEMEDASFVLISGRMFERLHSDDSISIISTKKPEKDGVSQSQYITKELMKVASQVIVDHISLNNKNYKETYELLISQLQNEILEEARVRTDVQEPREKLIYEEFESRKRELNRFNDSFKQLYLCFEEFEKRLTDTENNFTNDANAVITSLEEAIERSYKNQLMQTKSKDLITHNTKFEGVLWDLERQISDKAKSVLTSIDKDAKMMRDTEEKFMDLAKSGNFEFGESCRNFIEFCETRDHIRNMIVLSKRNIKHVETLKNKRISTAIQNYKSHYKHCLLDLFFLEMKSSHLAKVKMQIKCAASHGDSVFPKIKDMLKEISASISAFEGIQSHDFLTHVQNIASSFMEGFEMIKSLINFYNFRCSPISFPAKNSLEELNQRYRGFSAPDPSVEDTIEFTKNILHMTSTSCKNSNVLDDTGGQREENDDNWLADSSNIEKKYLTGKITCVYGVGANILDTANQNWSQSSSTQISVNSFWLNKNPEGLQALKGLQTEKKIKERLAGFTPTDNISGGVTSGSKLKEISEKIRSLVFPSIQTSPSRKKPITDPAPSQQLLTVPDSINTSTLSIPKRYPAASHQELSKTKEEHGKSEDVQTSIVDTDSNGGSTPILPTISIIKEADPRKSSFNQMNMAKVLNLNKTVDLLRSTPATRRKRSTHLNRNQNICIYDFLIMTDDELRTFVFDPLSFFNLQRRTYDVNYLCENIVSITEKVKFYLFHLQEDFIIPCLLFYRQKHLSIKYRQRMKLNHDSAISDFTENLKKYLRNIYKQCDNRIQKIKSDLASMYKIFVDAPLITFEKIHSQYKEEFSQLFTSRLNSYQAILEKIKNDQQDLSRALHPRLTHPNNESILDLVCRNEQELLSSKELVTYYEESMKLFSDSLKEFESTIKSCSEILINTAESAIQVEDIRRMTTKEGTAFEVQKRLRQNLVITTSLPIPRSRDIRANSCQVNMVDYQKLQGTINKLIFAVLKAKDSVISLFRDFHSCKLEDFSSCHSKSMKELQNWHRVWEKSIAQIND